MAHQVSYITDAQFQSAVLESQTPVLLDFTAVWCGPCKAIAPLLDKVSEEKNGALKVVKLDIDNNPNTPNKYGIQSIPTLLLFKDGKVVAKQVGSLRKQDLDAFVAKAF